MLATSGGRMVWSKKCLENVTDGFSGIAIQIHIQRILT
jgi:hypothetical protein